VSQSPDFPALRGELPGEGPHNIYFDVDHTLLFVDQYTNVLRPGARQAMQRLKESGHSVYVWSAGGKEYVERMVVLHELAEWVDGCFDKNPKVDPSPDWIIDDDWYLVEKYNGYLVSQYKRIDEMDNEFEAIIEALMGLGHL
jgi:hypothetical protein